MDAGECFLSSPGQDERSSWPLDVILPPFPETTKDTSLLPPSPSHDISTSTEASTPGGSYKALSPQPSTSQPTLLVATSPLHPKYLPKLRTPAESNCQEEEKDEGEPLLGRVLFSSDGYVYLLKGEGKENQTLPSPASSQDSLNSTVLPCTPPNVFRLISTYQGICSNQISQHTSAGAANPIHMVSGASSKIQDQPKENKVVERGQETNKTLKLTRGSQRTQIVERVLICLPCQLTFRSGNKFGWHASHIHALEHPYQDHLAMRESSGIIHSSSGQIFLSLLEPKINHSSLEADQEPENIALLGDQSPLLLERIQTVLEPSGKSKDVTSPIPDTVTKSQVAINPEINSVSLGLAPQSSLSFHCCDPAGTPHLTEAKESKAHMNDENGGATWNPAGTKTQGEEDAEEGERPPPNSQSTDITEQLLANQSFYGPMLTSSFSHIGIAPGNDKRGDHTDTERGLQVLDDCTATSGPQSFQSLSLQGQLSLLHSRNSCKTLKCPKCNWHYKYQQTLDVHMKEKHPESQSHCSYCHNGQQHPRLARGESYNCGYKPYRCEACNYSTTTKGNLTIHMQSDKHLANLQSYQGPGTTPNAAVPPLASPVANTGQGEGGQPSPPDRQLKQKASWHCKVCNYETNISRNLRIHMTSEKHMQNVLMLHQGLGMGQDTFPFYGSSLAPDQGMDHHLLFNPLHFSSSGNQACSLLIPESVSGPQLNSLGPSIIPIPSSPPLQDSFSSNLEEEPSTGIFQCLICCSFATDSLEGLLSHASRGRSLPEREWREVRGDLHCCRLCSYSTQLKANFQLHLKTDKHAQKYQLAAHMREGGAALATAQASAVELPISGYSQASSFPPLNLRCNLCGFDSNSREKLQLHVQGGGHEESLRVYKFLNSMEGAGESDTSFRCGPCDSIVSSHLGMMAHLRSTSHHQSLAQWRLTQGEVMLEGIISVCRGALPQEHVKTLRTSEATPNSESDEESKDMSQGPGQDEAPSTEGEKPAEGTTVFCCPFCAYVSPSEDQVQSHAVSQHALQPTFRCPLCQEQLTGTANLRAHLGHGHNVVSECVEKLLQVAQKVDMSFRTRILPIRVREEPTQPTSEVHTSCDIPHQPPTSPPESPPEISTSPVQATEHEGDLDKSQEDNSCTACQQLCDSSNDLQEHLEKDHPDLSPSDLQQACEARNRESEVLELDDKTGSQENIPAPPQQVTYRKTTNFAMDKFMDPSRPHKCVVCKESFTQKNILLVHYNSVSHLHKVRKASLDPSLSNRQEQGAASQSHGGQSGQDKPYKCTVCHVSYNQSSTLEIHMRSVLHQTRSRGSKYELAKAPAEKSQRDTICKNEPTNDVKNEPSGELQSAVAQKRRQHIAPCLGVPILPAVAPPAVQLSLDLPRPPPLVQPPPLFASSLLPSFPLIPEALLKLQRQQQQLLLPFYLQELKVGGDGGAPHVLPFGGAQQPPSIKEEGDQYSATPRAAKENEDKMPDEQEAATGEADGCQNSESKLEPAPKGAGDPTVSTAHTLLENFGFELVAQYNEGRQPKSSQLQVQPPPPAAPPSVSPTPPSIEKLQCGTCGKLFSNRLILKTHEEHMHQRLLPFEALNQYAARYRRSYDSHNPTGVPMETPSSSVTPLDFSVTSQCSQQTEEKEESGDVSITAEQLNCLHSLLDLSSNPVEEHFLWAANKTDLPPAAIQQWYAQEKTNNEGQEEEGAEASKYDRMGNRRFSRTKFSDFQTQALNSFFEYSAYPRDSEVENLSTLLSLPGRVVVVWFQNARQKARKQAVETGYSSSPPLLPSPPGERPAANSKVPPCKKCGITMPCIFRLIHHLKECYNEQHEEVAGEEEKQEVSRNPSQEEVAQVQEAAPEIPLIFIQVKDEEQKALEEKNIVPSDAKESVRSSTINEEHPQLSEQKSISEEQNLISTTPEMLDQNQLQADNNNVPTNLMDLSLVIPAGPSDTGTQRKRKHEEESLSPTCSEGGDEPPKDKRLRTTILPEQLDILHQWYLQDSNPTRGNLERISLEVRLKKRVVQVWFQNTRARERKGQYRGAPPTVTSGSRQQDDAPNEGTKREATTSFYYSVSPSQVTPSIVTKAVSCPGQGSSPLFPKTQTSLGMTSMAVTSKSLVCPSQALSGILNTTQILPNLINPPQAIPGLVKSTPSLTGLVNPPQGLPSLVNPTQTFPTLVNPAQVLSSLVNSPQSSPGLLLASYTSKPTVASILLHTASEIKQPTTGLLSSSQLSGDQTQKRDKTGSAVVDNPDQNKNVASEQQVHPQTPEDHPLECKGGSNQKSFEKGAAKPLESLIHSPQGGEMSDSSSSDPGPPSPGKGGINAEGFFGSTGARRFRTQMSSLQLRILKACYSEYRTPSMHECDSLGGEIGLQKRVVQVWFQNARAKEKKAKLQGLSATVTSNEGPQPTECTHCNVKYGPTTPCRAHIFSRQHIARLRATIQQQIKEESRYRDNHPTAVAPLVSESKQTSQMLSFQGSNSASPQIQRITPLLMPGQGIPAPIGGLATFNAGPPPGLLGITSTVPPTLLPRATPAAPTSSHSTSETMVDSSQPTATSEQNTGSAVLKGASLMGTPFMPFPLTPAATPLFTPQIQGPYFQQLYGLKKRLFPINPVIPHTLLGLLPGSLKPNPEPSPHQKTDCPQTKATNQCSGEQEAMTGEEESFEHEDDLEDEDIPMVDVAIRYQCQRCKMSFDEEGEAEAHQGSGCYPGSPPHPPPLRQRVCTYHCLSCQVLLQGPAARNQHLRSQQHRVHSTCGDGASSAIPQLRPKSAATSVLMAL